MRYRHHHGDLNGWIVGGIGLAIAFLLFKLFAGLLALGAMIIWSATANLTTGWRQTTRFVFVAFIAFMLLMLVTLVFAE